ncbi:hypothetical protein XANCAGTX0491_000326 [Xanthoria calcicola]
MPATYNPLSQSESTTPQKQSNRSSRLLDTFFSSRRAPASSSSSSSSSPKSNKKPNAATATAAPSTPPTKPRGVVGADAGELSIRASTARKNAFQLESFANGDYGCDGFGGGDTDEEDMEKEMEEMRFLLQYESQDLGAMEGGGLSVGPGGVEGRERGGGRQRSLAARLLRKGA